MVNLKGSFNKEFFQKKRTKEIYCLNHFNPPPPLECHNCVCVCAHSNSPLGYVKSVRPYLYKWSTIENSFPLHITFVVSTLFHLVLQLVSLFSEGIFIYRSKSDLQLAQGTFSWLLHATTIVAKQVFYFRT